jgi:hypothetical protein
VAACWAYRPESVFIWSVRSAVAGILGLRVPTARDNGSRRIRWRRVGEQFGLGFHGCGTHAERTWNQSSGFCLPTYECSHRAERWLHLLKCGWFATTYFSLTAEPRTSLEKPPLRCSESCPNRAAPCRGRSASEKPCSATVNANGGTRRYCDRLSSRPRSAARQQHTFLWASMISSAPSRLCCRRGCRGLNA